MRYIFILIFFISLSACSATGPKYNDSLLQQHPDKATVLIFRTSSFQTSGEKQQIIIDSEDACLLRAGSYFIKDLSPGEHKIQAISDGLSFEFEDLSTSATFDFAKGKKYFIELAYNEDRMTASKFGLLGALAYEAAATDNTYFNLKVVSENYATIHLRDAGQICLD